MFVYGLRKTGIARTQCIYTLMNACARARKKFTNAPHVYACMYFVDNNKVSIIFLLFLIYLNLIQNLIQKLPVSIRTMMCSPQRKIPAETVQLQKDVKNVKDSNLANCFLLKIYIFELDFRYLSLPRSTANNL